MYLSLALSLYRRGLSSSFVPFQPWLLSLSDLLQVHALSIIFFELLLVSYSSGSVFLISLISIADASLLSR